MRKPWLFAGLAAVLIVAATPLFVGARGGTQNGCYVCEPDGFMDTHCSQVGDGQNGDGISCEEYPNGVSHNCRTFDGACTNTDVCGGGGGTGDGGGGGCTYEGGYCPPSCMSCSGGDGGGGYVY